MTKNIRSIEEQIEDLCKIQLKSLKYYTKTESINEEIENALKAAPSKSGGKGTNYPDIKLFIETKGCKSIPVMIEVKGKKNDLIKTTPFGEIDNKKKDGDWNFANISKYAVNGAIHYANALVQFTESYKEVISIGVNGYYNGNNLVTEYGVYYISAANYFIPKEIDKYSDLSFLLPNNRSLLIEKIKTLNLSIDEIEKKTRELENEIEIRLKKLNQKMQDDLRISVGSRVELVTGLIMAGLGIENKVAPLEIKELKGETGKRTNDGYTIINKIDSFLEERNLPNEKKAN